MKKSVKNLRNIFIGIGLVLVLGFIVYLGVSENILQNNECSQVSSKDPTSNFYNSNCNKIYDRQEGRELYVMVDLPNSLMGDVNNKITRIKSVSLNNDLIAEQSRFGYTGIGIHTTSNSWDARNITWENKPSKESEIGVVSKRIRPTLIAEKITENYLEYYSNGFNENLLYYVLENIKNNEEKISFVLTQESDHDRNSIINNIQINYILEDSEKYYSIKDNLCIEEMLFEDEVTISNYNTLPDCEQFLDISSPVIVITPEENNIDDINYYNLLFLLIPFAFLLVFFIILKKKSKRGRK